MPKITKLKAPKVPKSASKTRKTKTVKPGKSNTPKPITLSSRPPRSGNTPIKLKNKKVKPENIGISARRTAKLRAEGKLPPPKRPPTPGSWKPGQRVLNVTYGTVLKQNRIDQIIEEMMVNSPDALADSPTNSTRIEWCRQLLMQANAGDKKAIQMILDRWKGAVTTKTEISNPDGSLAPRTSSYDLSKMSLEDKKAMRALLAKAVKDASSADT